MRSARAGFWLVAAAFLVSMAFSTVPTPLYSLYQRRDGFSSFVVTVVFAAYAVGVIASLLLAGHVSDQAGRKRILLPAIALNVLAAVVFLVWPAVPGLIVARVMNGLGIGMITATATAYLRDLHALDRPDAGPERFEMVSTAANLGGLGLGALASGALAQFVPGPLRTPYAVFAVLMVASIYWLAFAPETVEPPEVRPRYRPQRVAFGGHDPASYAMAAAGAFVGFAVFGLFTSLAPEFVGTTLHHPARLLAGVVAFIPFGAAAAAQAATTKVDDRRRLAIGLTAEVAGILTFAIGMEDSSLATFLIGGGLAGAGSGLLFKSALATIVGKAPATERGEAAAGLFLFAYAGLIVPVLGIGVATEYVSARTAMALFSAALLAIMAVAVVLAIRTRAVLGAG